MIIAFFSVSKTPPVDKAKPEEPSDFVNG